MLPQFMQNFAFPPPGEDKDASECVLTAIELFAKTVKYEYYMNEYWKLSVLTAIIHLVPVVIR